MRIPSGVTATAFFATFASATAVQAQIPQAVYDDALAIVEDVISKETVHSIVPTLACEEPSLVTYYPRTLQHLYDQEFGSIRVSLQDEIADYAASQIYNALAMDPTPPPTPVSPPIPGALPAAPRPATSEKLFLKYDAIALAPQPKDKNVVDALGSALGLAKFGNCTAEQRGVVAARFQRGDYALGALEPIGGAPNQARHRSATGSQIDQDCATNKTMRGRYACELALAARASLQSKTDSVEDHAIRALALVLAQWLEDTKVIPSGTDAKVLDTLTLVLRTRFARPQVPGSDDLSTDVLSAIGVKNPVRNEKLERLVTQWRVASGGGTRKVDIAAIFTTVVSLEGVLVDICPQASTSKTSACDAVLRNNEFQLGSSSWSIAQAINKGAYREASILAIRDMIPVSETCSIDKGEHADTCENTRLYRRFAETFSDYILASAEGQGATAARTAFRSAAEDTIQRMGATEGGGLNSSFARKIGVPDLALRVSWSNSYLNQTGSDGFRITPTIDWLSFRAYHYRGASTDVAFTAGFVDLLGPFAEIALRKTFPAGYSNPAAAWILFVKPHLDLSLGYAALSTHLALVAGASMRLTAPYADIDGTGRYTFPTDKTVGNTTVPVDPYRFVEFNLGIKYVL